MIDKVGGGYAKCYTFMNIAINLIVLGIYKYYDFFAVSLIDAFALLGVQLNIHSLNLILPVGISFYTFQALSYTIDVYKQKIEPTKDIFAFFAYISFFPQLVAGPIERATNLLPQFLRNRDFNYDLATDGCRQILWGFCKKIIIADQCASIVNLIWDNYQNESGMTLLVGAILFSFQIYGDFSGYSDIAIGTAKLFGIRLMANFKNPYFSRDVAEFWKRWHISLNTWFVDYVYIPLGGSRNGKIKKFRNTLIIFLLSGLWHGANWTFVLWGLYHALLFLPLMIMNSNHRYNNVPAEGRVFPTAKEIIQIGSTFLFVMVGWIIFRAENIEQLSGYLFQMCELDNFFGIIFGKKALLFCLILLLIEWVQRKKDHSLQLPCNGLFRYHTIRYILYICIICVLLSYGGEPTTFIYFQF